MTAAKCISDAKRADYAVFMEAILPIGSTVPGAGYAIDFAPALLCGQALQGEHRMIVLKSSYNLVWINRIRIVQCNAECLRCVNPLQDVHVVSDDGAIVPLAQRIVPAAPSLS